MQYSSLLGHFVVAGIVDLDEKSLFRGISSRFSPIVKVKIPIYG